MAHAAPFLAHHSCHRNGRKGGHKVYLDHSTVGDDEDADGDGPGTDTGEQGLKPQSQKRPDLHIHEPGFQIGHHGGDINAGISCDNTRCAAYHTLGGIEYTHDDVPCICDDQHCSGGFEGPLEEHPGIYIVQIVFVCYELDQLKGHNKGEDCPRNRDDHGVG